MTLAEASSYGKRPQGVSERSLDAIAAHVEGMLRLQKMALGDV